MTNRYRLFLDGNFTERQIKVNEMAMVALCDELKGKSLAFLPRNTGTCGTFMLFSSSPSATMAISSTLICRSVKLLSRNSRYLLSLRAQDQAQW